MVLRSVDPRRFRTRARTEQLHEAGMAPVVQGKQFEKPERRKPLSCLTCGGTNINGAEEHDDVWYVWCVACDSRQLGVEERIQGNVLQDTG